jgi:hypothetical protein
MCLLSTWNEEARFRRPRDSSPTSSAPPNSARASRTGAGGTPCATSGTRLRTAEALRRAGDRYGRRRVLRDLRLVHSDVRPEDRERLVPPELDDPTVVTSDAVAGDSSEFGGELRRGLVAAVLSEACVAADVGIRNV